MVRLCHCKEPHGIIVEWEDWEEFMRVLRLPHLGLRILEFVLRDDDLDEEAEIRIKATRVLEAVKGFFADLVDEGIDLRMRIDS